MSTEIATLEADAQRMTADVTALTVTDAQTFGRAGEMARAIAGYIRRVGEVLDPIVDAAHKAHKTAVAQRDALLKPAQGCKRILGERMATWEQEQARIRRAAEEAAQRERERLEHQAREAAEREQRRLREEAETRRLEEAAALEARGDRAGAERLLDAPVATPTVVAAPVFVAPSPVAPAPARVEGVAFRDEWDFEIVDATLLPREYLIPDERRIRGVVRSLRSAASIPGVRVFSRRIAAVRG